MEYFLRQFGLTVNDPAHLFGHFTYLLLIVSMLMRDMPRLRAAAIVAGISKVIYRAFFVLDPVSLLWESIFVLVNVAQLALIWHASRPPRLTDEERYLVNSFGSDLPIAAAKALLREASWRDAAPGSRLTEQGRPLGGLIFIEAGTVEVVVGGGTVAHCGRGDFLGEMTWNASDPATATAVATGPVRYAWFERSALSRAIKHRPILSYALQASVSRNLAGKLMRANERLAAPLLRGAAAE